MTPREQIEIVFDLLKKHLRERKLTYAEIAKRTAMSEANIKRIFSVRSCDFERLLQICKAAEIGFFDLMGEAAKRGPPHFKLSNEAEEYFVKNFDCFVFYRQLSGAKQLNKMIASSSLAKDKLKRFIADLKKYELLRGGPGNYSLCHTSYLYLAPESKLRRKLEEIWVPWFFDRVVKSNAAGVQNKNNEHYLKMFSTGLSEKHRLQLIEDIERIYEKYGELGLSDQKFGTMDYSPVAICIGLGPYRVGYF